MLYLDVGQTDEVIIQDMPSQYYCIPHLLTLKHRRARVVDSDLLVVDFKVHGGSEDSGRVLVLLLLLPGLPGHDDGVIRDAHGLQVLDGGGQSDGSLFVAENDLSNVRKTLLVVGPCTLLVD